MRVIVSPAPIDHGAELARLGGDGIGALASFVGFCRGTGPHGPIAWLELEHYPGFTEKEIARIAGEITERFDIQDLLVIHRSGRIAPGEAIVLVAAINAHRGAAFAAVEAMMDYLKTDAPFWKREMREDGAHWIEPSDEDRRHRARHEKES
jgi:molybdopterin synthase catalytic subunit